MKKTLVLTAFWFALPAAATEPFFLIGIRENGNIVRIDPVTGTGVQLGGSGISCAGALGFRGTQFMGSSYDYLATVGAAQPYLGHQLLLDRWHGSIWQDTSISGVPLGHRVAGLGSTSLGTFCIFQPEDPSAPDLLARLDPSATSWLVVGPTGRTDLTCLTAMNNTLLALGSDNGGSLWSINPSTGSATFIGGGTFAGDVQALAYVPNGQLLCCGANLRSIDPLTGQTSVIGPTGFSDFSGLAVFNENFCRAECDGTHHGLTANDFQCFLVRFALGDPWCNCDESTGSPMLTVNDFQCFLNAFAGDASGHCW